MLTAPCAGDVCQSDIDCDGDYGCSSGVCSISGSTLSGEDEGGEDESQEPAVDTPYTQWSPEQPATVNPGYTTVYVTVSPRATGAA